MKHVTNRVLSLLLVVAMVLSMVPVSAFAAETTSTWSKVELADITADDTVAITMSDGTTTWALYNANGTGSAPTAVVVDVADNTMTAQSSDTIAWNIAKEGDDLIIHKVGDANTWLYSSNTNNGTRVGTNENKLWTVDSATGYLKHLGTNRYLGVYKTNPDWRSYTNTTGNTAGQTLAFWKLDSVVTDPDVPGDTQPDVQTIAQALAGENGTEFTVKGVVTMIDGRNIYLQDETGAICVYMAAVPGDISLGDTVIGTGVRGAYSGMSQLSSGTYEKSEGMTLTARETTIDALTEEDVCSYVSISNLQVTAVSGTTVTVSDGTNTIQIYKAVIAENITVGATINFTGAVGIHNSNLQLRNTLASEITLADTGETDPDPNPEPDPEPEIPEGTRATLVTDVSQLVLGDEIIFVAVKQDVAMGVSSGNYFASVDITKSGSDVFFGEDVQTMLLASGTLEDTYAFNAAGNYLCAATTGSNHLKAETSLTAESTWSVEITDGVAVIKSQGNTTKNWIRYNSSSPRFSCYASGQQDIAIYKVERPQYAKLNNEITDGDQFVIYYNNESTVMGTASSGGKLEGVAAIAEDDYILVEEGMAVLTASADESGDFYFINEEGKFLTTGATGSSLTFEDSASDYSVWQIESTDGGVLIKSKNAVYSNNPQYIEVYNSLFTTFSLKQTSNKIYYTFNLYALTDEQPPESSMPADGEQVVLYNLDAQGVLAAQNDNTDSPSIENAPASIADGVANVENGGVVFTVETNGNYYRFYNETYGYLSSNGTGNNAFYAAQASEDSDWTLTVGNGGYYLESRTAKFNGTYSQYLEYYSDSYKTYSMYNVTNYDIYTFQFYPVAENTKLTGGIVNKPAVRTGTLPDAYIGVDYSFSFTVDAPFGVKELTASLGNETLPCTETQGTYNVVVPAELVADKALEILISGLDSKDVSIWSIVTIPVKDEPVIDNMVPAAGSETGDDKRPVICADIVNAGQGAAVTMTVNNEAVEANYANGVISYTPDADLADGSVSVTVTVQRADGTQTAKTWRFTVGKAKYQLYFGQLHSHTTYSDGSGSLDTALNYIANLPESASVDFVAFTDHSNYFDTSGNANPESALYDMAQAGANSQQMWSTYKDTIAKFNNAQSDVIALGGFEMTWSGGPGHINTFNTPGIVSRNNSTLNNKTGDAGMKAYYALLSQAKGVDSISQFNHPGTTFGNFSDFAYWDALIDTRIQLVEVGNGEGAVGAGGYYPSYEQYTMALDKGWHVSPTNNQDNHKGKWGNANDARDVVLTDDFSEEGIYQAIRDRRVYATEDKNLEIYYTVNGKQLGSVIEEVPKSLNFKVQVNDPDASDTISKVEVIVNSGKVAYTWSDPAVLATGELTATLAPSYSYYYIRVTQGDGELAVTSPVWVGESLKLGISSVESGTSTPVTGEELTISTTLFNSESGAAKIKSLTYTTNGSVVLGTDTTGYEIPASGNTAVTFRYIPDAAKLMNITVTAVVELNGVSYTFSMDVELDVQDASKLVYIGIDASHYNEYVAGNYKDSMGNFSALAAGYAVRTVELKTSEDLIAACSNDKYTALILTAPSRRLAAAQSDPRTYSTEELAAIKAFHDNGGTVILAGWSDNYENYNVIQNNSDIMHMAATQNAVLETLGSSLRIGDDATYDDVRSAADGVDKWRLYFNTYGDSFLTEGVEVDPENPYDRLYTEVFSHYGGASVYTQDATLPATVTPVVYAHASTYSVDVDQDGLGGKNVPKYAYAEGDERLMVMATEQLDGKGLIVVSGAAFMSNFEVQATIEDSGSEKNYSNYRICENLVQYLNPVTVTDIAQVQAQTEAGYKYIVEGVVTSNASGYDKDTAFFDCIYVQDATGGICCFPVAGNFKIGDKVRVTGTTEFYQGEMELQVSGIEVIGQGSIEATEVTAQQINDRSVEGRLVTLKGTVKSFEYANGLIQTIMVEDEAGNVARVFIDGYITTAEDVQNMENGCAITVTGLASYDDTFNAPDGPFPRIRIRNRADVVCHVHVHSFTDKVIDPTCVADGYTEHSCNTCGYIYRDEFTDALGHDMGTPVVTDPTHDEMGYTTAACKREGCGYSFIYDYTSALGHSYTREVTRQPSCSELGEVSFSCSGCDSSYTMELPLTGHRCEKTLVNPTCVDGGYTLYECSNCDYSYIADPTKAAGHTYGEPVCQGNGICVAVCEVCEYTALEQHVCPTAQYTDLSTDAWYHTAADAVLSEGIMNGTAENVFSPDMTVNRAQIVTVLYRLAGEPDIDSEIPFTDVAADSYYAAAVAWGYEAGIVMGLSETEFGPDQPVTRQQMVTFLYRYNGEAEADSTILKDYTDADQLGQYAVDPMSWAVANGIITGSSATTLSPQNNAKRIEAAAVIHRFLSQIK